MAPSGCNIGNTSQKVARLFLFAALSACDSPHEPLPTPPIHTPRWAFRPWISKDISTTDDSYDFVGGFRDRDIPVGVLVLDSPWETDYHTFIPNPVRYHDFEKLVSDLRAKDIRLVLWTTQLENTMSYDAEAGGDFYPGPNPEYDEGKKKGYFVDDAALYDWWKGTGCGIDFFNAGARDYWHALQDRVLDLGVAGWKLDFGDTYVTSDPVKTAQGLVSHQAYSEEYYRDFFAYGAQKLGEDFVTMVRPWDKSYQWDGRFYARPEHAPVSWVGDNRRDWIGLADALDSMFRSARAGYVVIGSDIGGYLNLDDQDLMVDVPFDAEVFLRWLAVGALTPFMQLHGRANLEPWALPARSDEAVASYRYWASLHEAMVPYFYGLAEEAYAKRRGPILDPQGEDPTWAADFRFGVGDALFVAPLLDGTGARDVLLPSGSRWYDWWEDAAAAIDGGSTVHRDYAGDARRIPLFLREGSVIPLDGNPAGSGLDAKLAGAIGLPQSGGALVVLATPGPLAASFTLHEREGEASLTVERTSSGVELSAKGTSRALLVRLRVESAPTSVSKNGSALAMASTLDTLSTTEGWWKDPALPYLWIRAGGDLAGVTLSAQ